MKKGRAHATLFEDVMIELMGDYAQPIASEVLMERAYERTRPKSPRSRGRTPRRRLRNLKGRKMETKPG
jgi:hypothetical protein